MELSKHLKAKYGARSNGCGSEEDSKASHWYSFLLGELTVKVLDAKQP